MKRNVFGAMIVAGGLALATSVAGFAKTPGDFNAAGAKDAIAACATAADAALTVPTTLTGDAKDEALALKHETVAGIAEIKLEANNSIDEVVADSADESAAEATAELTQIVDESCKAIANLKAEFDQGIAELVAESTKVEQPEVNQPEVDKHETETRDSDKRGLEREGRD
jgi:hypothetical protein